MVWVGSGRHTGCGIRIYSYLTTLGSVLRNSLHTARCELDCRSKQRLGIAMSSTIRMMAVDVADTMAD